MLKHILVVFILFFTGLSMAQEGTTSPYSFYGIGELKFKGTSESRAMGGVEILSDSIHLNILNPAGIADLKLINYSVGTSHRLTNLKTENESDKASTTSFDYIAVGIPMGKIAASFGIIPYTSVGYQIESLDESSLTRFTGEGGLNRAFLSLAYKITPDLNVGIETSYNFGSLTNTAFRIVEDIQYGTKTEDKSDVFGVSFNFGLMYKTMVSENLQLSTSVAYTPETDFTSENARQLSTIFVSSAGIETPVDLRDIVLPNTDFTFPSQFTLGAGIGQPKKWFVGGQFTSQKTSNFTNRIISINTVEYKDASKYSLGGFFIPNYNTIGNYWSKVVYRMGIRYEETGINISGEDINEFGISFGVGLPVGRLFSNVNLGFELGQRGTTNQGLVKENFFNTFLSLSLNDKWFEKRYYD